MECLICQNNGGVEGLSFWGAVICADCEGRLMEVAVDHPEYELLLRAFRLLWRRQLQAARDRHLVDGDQL